MNLIDEYIKKAPIEVQSKLKEIRKIIKETASMAAEKISYGMPTFYLNGNLVHFAAFSKHIGFYPGPSGIEKFKDELSGYKTSKGAIQFPLGEELPLELIQRIVLFRIEENLKK